MKYRLTFVLLILFVAGLKASFKSEVYSSYVNNRMSDWKGLIDQLNIQLNDQLEKTSVQLLELVNYQYGYIGWCLTTNRNDEALEYLKLAEENVRIVEERNSELSLVNAYKSAFYGYRIVLSKFSAPFIGHKSSECALQAILLDPNQPFGHIQLGNVKFHSPSLLGGSKREAIGYYLKAKAMMEKHMEEIHGDWNYLSLLTTIARAYESINDLVNAKLMYEEILRFEPEFTWIRDELYPAFLKKS
jgi:tetratricopeptide (TPR) repeat protein